MWASQASRCDLSRPSVHGSRERQRPGERAIADSKFTFKIRANTRPERQGLGKGAIADSKFNIQDKGEHEGGEAGIRGTGHGTRDTGHGTRDTGHESSG